MRSVDVLVVGAGPTGLTLACGLAAQGVTVRVVDRASGPAVTSRANILHARGVEVLGRVGALGDLPERSLPPTGMAMHVRGTRVATMRFAPDGSESVQALFVSQAAVEEQLRRRLGELGVEVEWGAEVTGAAQDADGVTVEFASGPAVRTGWLAGCDGARSKVRGLAGIAFPGVAVVEQFLLADVHAEWPRERSTSAGWFHRDGMLLAIPMPAPGAQDLWRLMADVPASGERLDTARIVARFEHLLAERADEHGVRIREAVWTSVFRIHRRLAESYRSGRMLLAGDAAHVHSPIGGQGMNTGIGDAENLAWKLALVVRGRADAALLETYTAERRPQATDVLRRTTANTRILLGEGPLARFVRDRVFVPLLNLPSVQRQATRTASQLWVTYRRGPLGGRGPAPRPGDRVPGPPAEPGPAWLVLAPAGEGDAVLTIARKHLGDAVVLRHTGQRELMLVRPDGHLAWRGSDPAGVQRWLAGALQRGRAA